MDCVCILSRLFSEYGLRCVTHVTAQRQRWLCSLSPKLGVKHWMLSYWQGSLHAAHVIGLRSCVLLACHRGQVFDDWQLCGCAYACLA